MMTNGKSNGKSGSSLTQALDAVDAVERLREETRSQLQAHWAQTITDAAQIRAAYLQLGGNPQDLPEFVHQHERGRAGTPELGLVTGDVVVPEAAPKPKGRAKKIQAKVEEELNSIFTEKRLTIPVCNYSGGTEFLRAAFAASPVPLTQGDLLKLAKEVWTGVSPKDRDRQVKGAIRYLVNDRKEICRALTESGFDYIYTRVVRPSFPPASEFEAVAANS